MAIDLRYAVLAGYLPSALGERITAAIRATGLPTWDTAVEQRTDDGRLALIAGLQEFREHLGGLLHITMLRDIGVPFEVTEMNEALVAQAIADLASVR